GFSKSATSVVEILNPFLVIVIFFLGLVLIGWIFLNRFQSILQERREDPSWLLMQQQIGQLGVQFGQVLESSTQIIQQQLGQILPSQHFATQYSFRSGEKVDAVIKLGGSLVPVDSKFPLENFKRILEATADDDKTRAKRQFVGDVRKHIDAIAAKYIVPDE